MPSKYVSASGYITGGASSVVGGRIIGITVFPGTAAGTFKIGEGVNGADRAYLPDTDVAISVVKDLASYHIPVKNGARSTGQLYATLTGTGLALLVEYQ
jgi:hypothetical protein